MCLPLLRTLFDRIEITIAEAEVISNCTSLRSSFTEGFGLGNIVGVHIEHPKLRSLYVNLYCLVRCVGFPSLIRIE